MSGTTTPIPKLCILSSPFLSCSFLLAFFSSFLRCHEGMHTCQTGKVLKTTLLKLGPADTLFTSTTSNAFSPSASPPLVLYSSPSLPLLSLSLLIDLLTMMFSGQASSSLISTSQIGYYHPSSCFFPLSFFLLL